MIMQMLMALLELFQLRSVYELERDCGDIFLTIILVSGNLIQLVMSLLWRRKDYDYFTGF